MILKEWKKEKGVSYPWIVKQLGNRWSRQHITNIFNGKGRMGWDLLIALMALTRIPMEDLLSDTLKRLVRKEIDHEE